MSSLVGGAGISTAMFVMLLAVAAGEAEAISEDGWLVIVAVMIPSSIVISILTKHTWFAFMLGMAFISVVLYVLVGLAFSTTRVHTAKEENQGFEQERMSKLPYDKQVLRRRRMHTQ
eukprot:TRINITY_DN16095_c0_g1_i1.p1 TRINITY_DN16095_c0_g1~~TRINITY_DN16095_c0_g1_i1.p1  ORF type:complete len:117 (-),score=11.27 TRINITY_DN16095_c0_g1_i1:136-486(-)